MGRGLHTVPLRVLLRHASVGSREQVQPLLPPPRRRPFWGGGRPLRFGGTEGRACGSPAWGAAGGGGGWGGRPPRPLLGLSGRGGGEWGGASGPLATPPDGRGGGGGGGMAVPAPGASHRLGGRALPPPPST